VERPKKILLTTIPVVAGILVAFILLNGTVMGTLLGQVTLPNLGTVKAMGVGVYWDSDCSNTVTSVNWGTVAPGSTNDVTVFIKNEGDVAETLSSTAENWNPSTASMYMSLSWDYAGQVIVVDGVIEVKLSLSVSSAIEGITSFSFDIIIVGSD
jgi:hypothetical protein